MVLSKLQIAALRSGLETGEIDKGFYDSIDALVNRGLATVTHTPYYRDAYDFENLPAGTRVQGGTTTTWYITDAGRDAAVNAKEKAAPKGTPTEAQAQAASECAGIRNDLPALETDAPIDSYEIGQRALVFAMGKWRQGIVTHTTKTRVHVAHANPTSGTIRVKAQDAEGVRHDDRVLSSK